MASSPILGMIHLFAGNFAPRGFLLCQGQVLPIQQYTALFSLLGTYYGGNGTTTFQLPNLGGSGPVGAGDNPAVGSFDIGQSGGVANVTLQTSQMPAHTHSVSASSTGAYPDPKGHVPAADPNRTSLYVPPDNTGVMSPQELAPTGGSLPFAVQNPCLAINFIIALEGVFPQRP